MNKADLVAVFDEMADIMEILGEDPFRVASYRRSARMLQDAAEDLEALAAEGRLTTLPGVGKGTAERIEEFIRTGRITRREELRQKVPAGLLDLLKVQGLGPKTAGKLWHEAGVTSLEEFRQALSGDAMRLLNVPGMGAKKVQQFREALTFADSAAGRMRLDEAEAVAAGLLTAVSDCPAARRVEPAGSLRRRRETIGDIDIVCEATARQAGAVVDAFAGARGVRKVLARGATKCSVVLEGNFQADLRIVPKASYGSALAYFTGSKAHNVAVRQLAVKRKLKLNEYGLFARAAGGKDRRIAGADEEGIYKALALAWIPPELREDRGEVAAAAEGKLPRLLEQRDILGDLHVHTNASDGANSIEEMIQAARAAGYKYLAITDHSKSQIQANGLDEKRLLAHARAIRETGRKYPDMLVLAGVEVDVLKDGRLDFPDEVLAQLDFVAASPHSALSQAGAEATRRLVRAMENPYVHVIGHPSGRLIGQRPGMDIEIGPIVQAAAATGTALEINADPHRLDLRDVHVRTAVEAGARLIICTDAHHADSLALMRFGVATARRGWATAADVINTLPPANLRKFLEEG